MGKENSLLFYVMHDCKSIWDYSPEAKKKMKELYIMPSIDSFIKTHMFFSKRDAIIAYRVMMSDSTEPELVKYANSYNNDIDKAARDVTESSEEFGIIIESDLLQGNRNGVYAYASVIANQFEGGAKSSDNGLETVCELLNVILDEEEKLNIEKDIRPWITLAYICDFENWHNKKYGNIISDSSFEIFNKKERKEIYEKIYAEIIGTKGSKSNKSNSEQSWVCSCGRSNMGNVGTCACGKKKDEIVNKNLNQTKTENKKLKNEKINKEENTELLSLEKMIISILKKKESFVSAPEIIKELPRGMVGKGFKQALEHLQEQKKVECKEGLYQIKGFKPIKTQVKPVAISGPEKAVKSLTKNENNSQEQIIMPIFPKKIPQNQFQIEESKGDLSALEKMIISVFKKKASFVSAQEIARELPRSMVAKGVKQALEHLLEQNKIICKDGLYQLKEFHPNKTLFRPVSFDESINNTENFGKELENARVKLFKTLKAEEAKRAEEEKRIQHENLLKIRDKVERELELAFADMPNQLQTETKDKTSKDETIILEEQIIKILEKKGSVDSREILKFLPNSVSISIFKQALQNLAKFNRIESIGNGVYAIKPSINEGIIKKDDSTSSFSFEYNPASGKYKNSFVESDTVGNVFMQRIVETLEEYGFVILKINPVIGKIVRISDDKCKENDRYRAKVYLDPAYRNRLKNSKQEFVEGYFTKDNKLVVDFYSEQLGLENPNADIAKDIKNKCKVSGIIK